MEINPAFAISELQYIEKVKLLFISRETYQRLK